MALEAQYYYLQVNRKKDFKNYKASGMYGILRGLLIGGYRIVEGNKERVQLYRGVVIKIAGHGEKKRFTVRKMSGWERFLLNAMKKRKKPLSLEPQEQII